MVAASVEQITLLHALTVGHSTRVRPRRLFDHSGIWPKQMGIRAAVGWCDSAVHGSVL